MMNHFLILFCIHANHVTSIEEDRTHPIRIHCKYCLRLQQTKIWTFYGLLYFHFLVAHQARLSSYLRGFRVDQSLLLQLPNVLGNRVGTHAGILADPPDTGPALMRFPVLAENQVGVD